MCVCSSVHTYVPVQANECQGMICGSLPCRSWDLNSGHPSFYSWDQAPLPIDPLYHPVKGFQGKLNHEVVLEAI